MIDYREAILEIKDRVDIKDLMRRYFVKMEGDKVCCPFHNDHSPSMIAKNGRYYCFACGEHGDAIDFIQRWHGTDFKEALNIIADMYNLSFFDEPVKTTPKPETTKEWQARTDKEVKDKYMQFRDAEYDEMCSRYLQAQRIAEATSPAKTGGVFTEAYEKAINDMEYAKGWIDSYNNDMDRIKRGHLYGNSGTFKAL